MKSPLIIDYYTDILCVWAWIAQRRVDELNNQLGDRIEIRYHYMDIFGDVHNKINTQWQEKGRFEGFAKHVINAASDYENAPVNTEIWQHSKPTTSATSHQYLKAVELAYDRNKSIEIALKFRQAFFIDGLDISDINVLNTLLEQAGLDIEIIHNTISDGSALAALMNNYQTAKQLSLKGSPSYIIDNGRQTLFGNVGYRVLLANVEERLKRPSNEASWC
ncbi:DsbA family protein [Thalassotalea psychrophila]|uniref:DsbA family protein n=1 Tax=Thalassotalea psychrophila TaxID=3065647 RepID=A0ABY9TRZ4_9GAMM|nr:DsbA family protein [Colwelliaceae bacterium SQ149]